MTITTNHQLDPVRAEIAQHVPEQCPVYAWCDVDHSDPTEESIDSPDVWHREPVIEEEEVGVLRTDHLLTAQGPALSICEMTDWTIAADEAPTFFRKMREYIDEAERCFEAFKQEVTVGASRD